MDSPHLISKPKTIRALHFTELRDYVQSWHALHMYVYCPTNFGIKEGTIIIYPLCWLGLRGSGSLHNFPNAFLFFGNSTEHLGFLILEPILISLKDVMNILLIVMGRILPTETFYKMILYSQFHLFPHKPSHQESLSSSPLQETCTN